MTNENIGVAVVGKKLALPFAFGENFLTLVIPDGKPPKDDVMMTASLARFQSKLTELSVLEIDSVAAVENMASAGYLPSTEGLLSEEFNTIAVDFLIARKWKQSPAVVSELQRIAVMCWENILAKDPSFAANYAEFIANRNQIEEEIKAAFEEQEEEDDTNSMFSDIEEESEILPENIDSEGPKSSTITEEGASDSESTFSEEVKTEEITTENTEVSDTVSTEKPVDEPEPELEPEPVDATDSLSLESNVPVAERPKVEVEIAAPVPAVALSSAVMEARANITAKVITDFMGVLPETVEGLTSDLQYCRSFDFELNYGFAPTAQVEAIVQGRIESLEARILTIHEAEEAALLAQMVQTEAQEKAGKIVDSINTELSPSLSKEEVEFELELVNAVKTEEFQDFAELAQNIEKAKAAKIDLINNLLLTVYSYDDNPVKAPVEDPIETSVIDSTEQSVTLPIAVAATVADPVAEQEEVIPLWKRNNFKSEEAMLKSIEDGLAQKQAQKSGANAKKEKQTTQPKAKKYERTTEHDFHASQGTKKYPRASNNLKSLRTMFNAQQSTKGREGFEIAPSGLTGNAPILGFPANLDIGNRLTMGVCHFGFNQTPYITGLHPSNLMKTKDGKDIGTSFEWPTLLKTVKVSQRVKSDTHGNATYFTAEVPIKVPYILEGVLIDVEQKGSSDRTSFAIKNANTKLYVPIVVEATVPNMISMLNFGNTFVGTVIAPDTLPWQALSRKKFHIFYNAKSIPMDYNTYIKNKEQDA